ncbi:hypothetical protein G6F57_018726 [Rhizopus arrhizus]|nr:hypothetical protein G6F57_018726 [Rhizopus arrhizus]
MAVAIVDVLEQVDVEEADHPRAALTVNLCQVTGQLLQSCAPVGQPGQAIGLGQLAQFIALLAQPPEPLVHGVGGHHQQPGHRQLQRLHPVLQQPFGCTGVGDDQYQHRRQRGQPGLRPAVAAPARPYAGQQRQATPQQIATAPARPVPAAPTARSPAGAANGAARGRRRSAATAPAAPVPGWPRSGKATTRPRARPPAARAPDSR